MDQFVQQTLKQYREEFGEDFDPTWNPTSEQELADKLRSSQADFSKWRSKNGRVWKTLTAIALPISNLGKIAASAAEATFPPAAAGVAGLLSLVTAGEKVSEANGFLEQMFTKLDDVLSRWKIDARHEIDDYMKDKMRQTLLLLFSIIARSRKVMKHGRTKRWLAGLAFGDDRKTADLMEELESLLQSEDRTRMALSLDRISALWEKAIRTENAAVVEKLNSPAVQINETAYAYRLEDKLVDTGTWLREDALYRSWINKETSLLMVLGGPGSGKSYLATTLIEDMLQKWQSQDAKSNADAVAYYYFNPESSLTKMLTTMAYQLQQFDPEYRQHVVETLDQGNLRTAKEAWAKLFLDYWNSGVARGVLLIVDGLSQAAPDEIEVFAEMVRGVVKEPSSKIQVAIFGLIQLWGEFDFVAQEGFIEITSRKNHLDITAYVDKELSNHRELKKSKPEVRAEFRDRILEHCDGVFEWARLLMAKCKNQGKAQIRKFLDQPPHSLDDMVKSCFDQIMNDEDLDPDMLRTLLTLLTYEKWPLRFGEIYNMIQLITGEEHTFLWWNIVRKLSSIIRWRTSRTRQLEGQSNNEDEDHIEILDEDKGWSPQISRTWITFANVKIRNYAIRQGELETHSDDRVDRWPPSSQKSEAQMVKACLRVLQDEHIVEQKNWFLLVYPLRFMPLHLQALDLETVDPEDKLEIAAGLIWMFHDEEGLRRVALMSPETEKHEGDIMTFWRTWVETREHSDIVQSWLRWAGTANLKIDASTEKWVQTASVSRKELFKPLAEYLRRVWLDGDFSPRPFSALCEWEKVSSVAPYFLVTYDNMDEQEEFPHLYRDFLLLSFEPSVEDLMASAERMEPPRHGNYFCGLAVLFNCQERFSKALECLEAIPEDDAVAWAKAWLQSVSYRGLGDYDQAVSFARRASDLNPHARNDVESGIAGHLLRKGDILGALEVTKISYNRDPSFALNQFTYLWCLFLRKEYEEAMKVVRQLDEMTTPNRMYSHVVSLLIENKHGLSAVIRVLGQAYLFTDSQYDKSFIEEVLKRTTQAIAQAEGEVRQIEWQNELATFNFNFVQDGFKGSAEIGLANLLRIQDTKLIPDKVQKEEVLIRTRSKCAAALYRLACKQEADKDSELGVTAETLRHLADDAEKVDRSALSIDKGFLACSPGFYYGRWLRTYSSKDDESWRRYFRQPLLSCLEMLDDTHDQNDVSGIWHAIWTLNQAGDLQTSLALFGILQRAVLKQQPKKTKQSTIPDESSSNDEGDASTLSNATSNQNNNPPKAVSAMVEMLSPTHIEEKGQHHTTNTSFQDEEETLVLNIVSDIVLGCETCHRGLGEDLELYMCSTCHDICCGKCIPTTQLHPTVGYACGNHHHFDHIWPVTEEVMGRASVLKGDEIHLKKSWLKQVRAQWEDSNGN